MNINITNINTSIECLFWDARGPTKSKNSIQCLNKSHQSINIPFPSVTNNNTRKHHHMFANNMIFKLMRIAIANKNGTIHGFDKLNIFNFSVIDP